MTPACKMVFGASTISTMAPRCSWFLLNRSGVLFHATLFVFFVTVSVLSCIEMKAVGRGERFSRTSLRHFCTASGELFDVLQNGVFRSSRKGTFSGRMLQASRDTLCRSRNRYNLIQACKQRREAVVVLRPKCRG